MQTEFETFMSTIDRDTGLSYAEYMAADILPNIPSGKEIRESRQPKRKTGHCDTCGNWDSALLVGICDWCDARNPSARKLA